MGTIELLAAGWAGLTGLGLGLIVLRSRNAPPRGLEGETPTTEAGRWSAAPEGAGLLPFASRELDVEREATAALTALEDLAAQCLVELQVTVQPKLTVWADPYALRHVLTEVLTQAIRRAPGGGVLLCGNWHGGRVQLTITDDGAPGDPATLVASLRAVEQSIAFQGGTLDIECSVARGNILTLRLPSASAPQPGMSDDMIEDEPTARAQPQLGVPPSAR